MLPKAYTKPQPEMFNYKPKVTKAKGMRKKKNTPAYQKKGAMSMLSRGMKGYKK